MTNGDTMWESVTEGGSDEGWAELDENGWGALIAWAAGPENLRRSPVDDSTRTVTVTRTDKDGTVTGSVEAFTARDRQIVDGEANSYLADAGVEKRPPGWRWFVRIPEQFSSGEEFRDAVTGAVYASELQLTHPAEIAPVLKQAVQRLYSRQG